MSLRTRHRWRWLLGIALVAIAVVLVVRNIVAEKHEAASSKKGPAAIPVQTMAARKGDIGVYLDALGTVTPVYTVSVMARVQGQIMRVNYREGQDVRKDAPLVEIDPRPYAAAVTQAEGQLARDKASLRAARIDLARYRKAYARNAIPKQQLDDQEQLVFQDEGTVKADEGALESAKVNLAYCHITAPIDGRVGLRLVDPGNIVQANNMTSLLVITQIKPITVIFSVAEDYIPQIQEQLHAGNEMTVEVFDRAQNTKLATGAFQTLDNIVDTTTGTVKIRARFENEDEALFPNQFVNARLLVKTQRDVTLVASNAVQRGTNGAFVYVIEPNQTAKMQNVKIGTTENGLAEVEGLEPGQVVATEGFEKLHDGVKVALPQAEGEKQRQPADAAKRGSQ